MYVDFHILFTKESYHSSRRGNTSSYVHLWHTPEYKAMYEMPPRVKYRHACHRTLKCSKCLFWAPCSIFGAWSLFQNVYRRQVTKCAPHTPTVAQLRVILAFPQLAGLTRASNWSVRNKVNHQLRRGMNQKYNPALRTVIQPEQPPQQMHGQSRVNKNNKKSPLHALRAYSKPCRTINR